MKKIIVELFLLRKLTKKPYLSEFFKSKVFFFFHSVPVLGAGLFMILIKIPCFSQNELYKNTELNNSKYFEDKIKYILDDDLFNSLNLEKPELKYVLKYYEKKDYENAYREWGKYWAGKKQPFIISGMNAVFNTFDEEEILLKEKTVSENILKNAEKILRHEINGWGDITIKFGPTVDFNADFGQSGKYGFHYWGWSIPLIQAYLITKDKKFPVAFDELFNQWYNQRYRVIGGFSNLDIIYYELGLGSRNKSFLSNYFINIERDWLTHERMLKTMLGAGRWIYIVENFGGYRNGNFQAVASLTLALIGLAFPEFREADSWVEIGVKRLYEHLKNDFFEDGGHSERSPAMYTQLTYSQIRNVYYLLEKYNSKSELKDEIKKLLGRTIDWWISLITPTGEMPAINDAHKVKFSTDVLVDGLDLFEKPYVKGILRNLFGNTGFSNSPLPGYTSINLPASGFAVMRSDWTKDALYMNINYGKWGGGHTHKDLLDFEIYAFGKAMIIDAGIGRTYDDPLYYPWYQTSNAHNMVVINDSNMERKKVYGENISWSSLNNIDYFSGENSGYQKFGVRHKRQILFVKPNYWFIYDQLFTDGRKNKITWNLHLIENIQKLQDGVFKSGFGKGLFIYPAEQYHYEIKKGFAMVKNERKVDDFQEIPWLQFVKESEGRKYLEYAVLLYPFSKENEKVEFSKNGEFGYIINNGYRTDEIYFRTENSKLVNINTDAGVIWISRSAEKIKKACIIKGSYLKIKSEEIFREKSISDYEKQF